jgi:hypothetical protein
MSHKLTPKDAIERIATLLAELRAGIHGNPMELDTQDMDRLREIRTQVENTMDEHDALTLLRKQPWSERIPAGSQQDIEMTTQQIASDVARLQDIQKQDPALLHSSIDSLHHSWQQLDLLLEPHAQTFADAVRRSRSFTPQGRQ